MSAPVPANGMLTDWRRRAFATPLDTLFTIGVGFLLAWMAWTALDWGLFRAVFRRKDVALCQ